MKSLVLSLSFPPDLGGIQIITYEIVKRLKSENTVLCRYTKGSEEFDKKLNLKVKRKGFNLLERFLWSLLFRVNCLLPYYTHFYKETNRIIKRDSVDVIHCSHISTAILGYIFKRKYGIPYFIYTYGQEVMPPFIKKYNPFVTFFMRTVLNNAEKIYTMSSFTKSYIMPWLKEKNNVKIVELGGADTNIFKPTKKDPTLVKELDINDKKVLVTVARIEERKGIDFVIKSLNLVKRKNPNIKYIIVGDGEDIGRLKEIVRSERLSDTVSFVGKFSGKQLSKYYNLCDAFILNSRNCLKKSKVCTKIGSVEGFGVVFIEAAACKKPSIGGNSGGIPDAVIDGETGILVNPINIKDISNAIIKLLSDNKLARKMGENGYKRAVSRYNYDFVSNKILKDIKNSVKNYRDENEGEIK